MSDEGEIRLTVVERVRFKVMVYDFERLGIDPDGWEEGKPYIIREVSQIEWPRDGRTPNVWYGQGFITHEYKLLQILAPGGAGNDY